MKSVSLTSGLEPLLLQLVARPRLRVDDVEAGLLGGPVRHPSYDARRPVEHLVGSDDDPFLVGGLVAGVRQSRVLVEYGVGKRVGLPHGWLKIGRSMTGGSGIKGGLASHPRKLGSLQVCAELINFMFVTVARVARNVGSCSVRGTYNT